MSRIGSTVQAVEALYFHHMPTGKKVDMVAAVRVGTTHVFLDAKGRIYSTQIRKSCFYLRGSGMDDTLKGCGILGLISKEAAEKHKRAVAAANEREDRKWAAKKLADHLKMLGPKPTKAQQAAIEAAQAPQPAKGEAA